MLRADFLIGENHPQKKNIVMAEISCTVSAYDQGKLWARARAEMHTHVPCLLIVCTFCMLDQYPTILSVVTLYVAHSMLM